MWRISQAVAFSWSDYYLLVESQVLALTQVINPMYPFQTERIPLTSTIVITETIILVTTCKPYISDQVSQSMELPWTLITASTVDILVS